VPFRRAIRPPVARGVGRLKFHRFEGDARYCLSGDPTRLDNSPKGIRGWIETDAETAARAFAALEGFLTLESGQRFRLRFLAHTAGTEQAYFEMWALSRALPR